LLFPASAARQRQYRYRPGAAAQPADDEGDGVGRAAGQLRLG
jgi:hypothetical protein